MKIISWNTNGIRATIKQGNFIPLFDTYTPDIVCFQETKCEPDQLPEKDKIFGEYISYFAYSKKRNDHEQKIQHNTRTGAPVFYTGGL